MKGQSVLKEPHVAFSIDLPLKHLLKRRTKNLEVNENCLIHRIITFRADPPSSTEVPPIDKLAYASLSAALGKRLAIADGPAIFNISGCSPARGDRNATRNLVRIRNNTESLKAYGSRMLITNLRHKNHTSGSDVRHRTSKI